MRPHEEEWELDGQGGVWVNGRPVLTHRDRCVLASAAPNMARALLAFLPENGHTLECGNVTGDDEQCSDECRNARAALRKAGVL